MNLMVIGFGVFPSGVLRHMEPSVKAVVAEYQQTNGVSGQGSSIATTPAPKKDENIIPTLPPSAETKDKSNDAAHN